MAKASSKRQSFQQKYKIQKKVKEHKKKIKKIAKQNPHLLRKVKNKDPGIPNLWPLKQAMLRDAHEAKIEEMRLKAEEREAKKLAAKERKKQWEVDALETQELSKDYNTPDGKRKWYFRELRKVVDTCDVILEVVDARDPMGCRAKDIEKMIISQQTKDGAPSKRVVIVINKIDLVPADVVQAWVKYLRREFPTIAFKASTNRDRGFIKSLDVKATNASSKALDSKSAIGSSALLQLLKNYSRSLDVKKGMTVGVIGYPNVGKSSIINSLKMQRATQVSSAAGCTKALQHVRLDGNIMLVDSPGVLFSADNEDDHAGLLLRNALRPDQVSDPQVAIDGILSRCTREQLMEFYKIGEYTSTKEFLLFVAHRRGKMIKGGIPNLDEAARCVLSDWNSGKIPFYSLPPSVEEGVNTIVSQFSEAFDIEGLLNEANDQSVQVIRTLDSKKPATMDDDDNDEYEEEEEDDYEDMDDEEGFENMMSTKPTAQLLSSIPTIVDDDDDYDFNEF